MQCAGQTSNITDLTGELEDRNFIVTRGDSRISVQIAKNAYTDALDRENRFLIDDDDSPHKLSYQLTKPLKKGLVYNGDGTYKFVLQEVTATEFDNHELGIADYYHHFPKVVDDKISAILKVSQGTIVVSDSTLILGITAENGEEPPGRLNGKKVWI